MVQRRWFLSALIEAHPDPHGAWIWRIYWDNNPKLTPYTIRGKYEQLLFILPQKSPFRCAFADFSIFDPAGSFFLHKGYLDDLRKDATESKGQLFNPVVAIRPTCRSVCRWIAVRKGPRIRTRYTVMFPQPMEQPQREDPDELG